MKSKLIAAAGVAILAIGLSGCSYFYPHAGETPTPSQSASETASPSASPSETTTANLKKVVVEVIDAYADINTGVQVIAHVLDTSEDDGTCTLTVLSGGVSKSVTAKAESNVTDTQCFPLNLPVVGLTPGNATATVTYRSSKSQGSSVSSTIVIP